MSRARGTYTTLENWALDLAPSLPGAAGWVLLKLAAQLNYKRQSLTVGQLLDCLPYGVRAVQTALAFLAAEGYTETQAGAHVLCGPRTKLVQSSSQNVRVQSDFKPRQEPESADGYSAITVHNKKESEEREIKETTPLTPQGGEARNTTAPGVENHSWLDEADRQLLEPLAPDSAPADAGLASQVAVTEPPLQAPSSARRPKSPEQVPRAAAPPTGFQLVFGALALASYGGAENLTNEARARLGKTAKSLAASGYTAEDVPQIVAWIKRHEAWRTGSLAPATIAERAPAWKSGGPGNVPLAPGRHAAPDATPPSTAPRRSYA